MRVLDKGQERVAQQPRSVGWSTVGGKVTSRLASGVPSVGVRFAASAGPQDQSREPGKQHGDALTRVQDQTREQVEHGDVAWRPGEPGRLRDAVLWMVDLRYLPGVLQRQMVLGARWEHVIRSIADRAGPSGAREGR